MRTCRVCHDPIFERDESAIKYAVRHWAHGRCYIQAGKPLAALSAYQLGCLPAFALREAGLFEEAASLIKNKPY